VNVPIRRLAIWCALVACLAPASAAAATPSAPAPALPLSHVGRWITDANGRVVVMHGTNMVYKLAPYYPAAGGFGSSDAAFLQRIGFTAVRVGVIWEALEPQPGVFDSAYLNQIAFTVKTLAQHGIVSLLDFHQDQLNEEFEGEGWPTWAIETNGLVNTKTPFSMGYEQNPALQAAFENFWSDKPGPGGIGLQERYAAAWRYVAQRFAGNQSVLGYELINEPFPGSDYETCIVPTGCSASDAQLTGMYRKVDRAIRTVDHTHLVFYEPYVTFDFGFQDHLGPINDPRTVFAWHDYCLTTSPCSSNATNFKNEATDIKATGSGTFLDEFGASTQGSELDTIVTLADQNMVPWTEWAYCVCGDPTGSPAEGIVNDPRKPKTGANLVTTTLEALVEPYPHVIAGTPASWGYNRKNKTFKLTYTTRRATGRGAFAAGALSAIETPLFDYPGGYGARVSGGAIVSKRGASPLVIASCSGARTISVTVAPGARSSESCKPHAPRR
jgi:endoglycosylceramidase